MTEISEYLRIIQMIALYKSDDDLATTPYTMNIQRMERHEALFYAMLPFITKAEDFSNDDVYERMKEIFYHLDKVFALYNDFELDLKNTEHIKILEKDLEKFLYKTEVLYYLGGKINGIHGVIDAD